MLSLKVSEGFKRWPSDAGVTFEGFEEVHLKSRETVRKKLEDFIKYCNDARKPAIRVLLGEWGEGKTDAFNRYIKLDVESKGNYAFFVSTSTLSNAYNPETKGIYNLITTTPLSALKFLVALFYAIKEENREEKLPSYRSYENANDFIMACLNNLIGYDKNKKIFVFIDEFEELLLEKGDKLKEIISGVKEIINGRFQPIDENGEYAGCLHLIIAATPDAYYKLQVTEDTALVFGGLGRRANVIELPVIRKMEGIEFLIELLKYSYNNDLPKVLPIEDLGVFHAIYRVAQGNPGNMVSLFTRLFSSMRVDDKIAIIDEDKLFQFLRGEKVFIYGGSTSCLESDLFDRILRVLSEQKLKEVGEACVRILKKLAANVKPISEEKLSAFVRFSNVSNIISIINNELRNREKIKRTIIKVMPLNEKKSINDVKDVFKNFIFTKQNQEKYIKIDNFICSLNEFEDMITFFDLNQSNEIVPRIFLPTDRDNIQFFFEGISEEKSVELENIIRRRKLCTNEKYYLVSEALLSQIFPSPVPHELEFIRNREKRMKLWRDVTKNLSDYYDKYMPTAFLELLERSEKFKLEVKDVPLPQNIEVAEVSFDDLKINVIFYSINGDVKSDDVEDISRNLLSLKPIHCVFVLFTGDMTEEAREKIMDKELGSEGENKIIEVRLHPTLTKRVISIHIASKKLTDEILLDMLNNIIKKTVFLELDLENKVREWLKIQESKGLAIIDIPIKSTSDLREFADTLKFYINFLGKEISLEEIFDENQKILKFIKPEAKKIALIPDIEKPKFLRISEELEKNGFLVRKNGKLIVKKHPIEEKIIKILEKEKKITEKELLKYFIVKNPRYLTDIFIPILEYKGIIKEQGNYYLLTDEEELSKKVNQDYERLAKISENDKWKDFGYVIMTKDKGYRFISLSNFRSFVDTLNKEVQRTKGLENEVALQKLTLLEKLLSHFLEEYYPLISQAVKKKEEIVSDVMISKNNLEEEIKSIQKECRKWLKHEFDVQNVKEMREMNELISKVQEAEKISSERITELVEKIDENKEERKEFFFRKDESEAHYFNLKLYLIEKSYNEFKKFQKEMEETISQINDCFITLNQRKNQIKEQLSKLNIMEELVVSRKIFQKVGKLTENMFPRVQPLSLALVNLKEVKQTIINERASIDAELDKLRQCIYPLQKLVEAETSLHKLIYQSENLIGKVKEIFDIQEYKDLIDDFEYKINNIKTEYNRLSTIEISENSENLEKKIRELEGNICLIEQDLKGQLMIIEKHWRDYIQSCIAKLTTMQEILEVLGGKISEKQKLIHLISSKKDEIDVGMIEQASLKVSEINKIIEAIEGEFYYSIKNILSREEVLVLEFIINQRKKQKWIPLEEIERAFTRNVELNIKDLLKKLVEKRILQEGYTLFF